MAKSSKKRGLLIAFEGGEGAGKTTQIRLLVTWLKEEGFDVVVSREPGGTEIGDKIRRILLDPKLKGFSPRAELLLYEASRAQHVDQVIRPALEKGKVVITDRFADSSTVYQGVCRGLGVELVESFNLFATGGITPNLTFVLDVHETEGLARAKKRVRGTDRLEREKTSFHKKVRQGFRALAERYPERFHLLDARRPIESLAETIANEVCSRLEGCP